MKSKTLGETDFVGTEKYPADLEIDRLCDEFEDRLSQEVPDIGQFLSRVDHDRRAQLLYWLLLICKAKQPEAIDELAESLRVKYPQLEPVVLDAIVPKGLSTSLPKIPGYKVLRCVGRGGQGEVFLSIQERTGQQVAIKMVSRQALSNIPLRVRSRSLEQLEKEIRTAASLNHPNIVKVYDAGECSDGFFFVMQWVGGGSLADRTYAFNQVDVARIIRSVADAVDRAHESSVLHLDIKPHNILYDADSNQPMLADFGLARLARESKQSGKIAGTIGYMSPEQAVGDLVDERSDVYGLGASLYKLLCGQTPYQNVKLPFDQSEKEKWIAQRLKSIAPKVSGDLDSICKKCLAIKPSERYSNCRELIKQLDSFLLKDDARSVATTGRKTLLASPLFFVINAAVMIQLQSGWATSWNLECLIWLTMFSMYAVVFYVFGSVSRLDKNSPGKIALESLWAAWIGKMLAAMAIAASLRLLASRSPDLGIRGLSAVEVAVLMCYPMFAALTGLVVATMAPRYWRFLYAPGAICLASSILLMWSVSIGSMYAPIIYGSFATLFASLWGLKLRRLAEEFANIRESAATAETVEE